MTKDKIRIEFIEWHFGKIYKGWGWDLTKSIECRSREKVKKRINYDRLERDSNILEKGWNSITIERVREFGILTNWKEKKRKKERFLLVREIGR